MELQLTRPIEELIPKSIEWNNAEILEEVKTAMAKYDGLTYTDDQIAEAKADKAKLNNWVKALDKARIDYHNLYEAPYLKFKAQIDEITDEVKKASKKIDEQITAFDNAKKAEKRVEIERLFGEVFNDFTSTINFEQVFDERWLNATVKLPNVQTYLEEKHEKILAEIQAIKDLNHPHEHILLADYLGKLDLSAVLSAERDRQAKIEQANKIINKETTETAKPKELNKVWDLQFKVAVTMEQANALKKFFIDNKIPYERI